MNEFFQGVIATVGILGGLCAFTYWMFLMMEKRIDIKLDSITKDLHCFTQDLKEERRNKDALYKFVLDNFNSEKPKRSTKS